MLAVLTMILAFQVQTHGNEPLTPSLRTKLETAACQMSAPAARKTALQFEKDHKITLDDEVFETIEARECK